MTMIPAVLRRIGRRARGRAGRDRGLRLRLPGRPGTWQRPADAGPPGRGRPRVGPQLRRACDSGTSTARSSGSRPGAGTRRRTTSAGPCQPRATRRRPRRRRRTADAVDHERDRHQRAGDRRRRARPREDRRDAAGPGRGRHPHDVRRVRGTPADARVRAADRPRATRSCCWSVTGSSRSAPRRPSPVAGATFGPAPESTWVRTFDVSDPSRPTQVDSREYDGRLVTARQTGDVVRLVLASLPPLAALRDSGPHADRGRGAAREPGSRPRHHDLRLAPHGHRRHRPGPAGRRRARTSPCPRTTAASAPSAWSASGPRPRRTPTPPPWRPRPTWPTCRPTCSWWRPRRRSGSAAAWSGRCRGRDRTGHRHPGDACSSPTTAPASTPSTSPTRRPPMSGPVRVDGQVASSWSMDEQDGVLRVAVGATDGRRGERGRPAPPRRRAARGGRPARRARAGPAAPLDAVAR